MGLPRTFVGFSGNDINYYRLMTAWKKHKHIDFDFVDCQLAQEINSEDEAYIKRLCRARINMAGKYILLIGEDTKFKYKYVRWETDVAIEKKCTIIGVNLDGTKRYDPNRCPSNLNNIGAIFVPFNADVIATALKTYEMNANQNYFYKEDYYKKLGI